jgi:bHLH factor
MSSSSEEGEKYSLRPRSIAKRLEVEQKLKLVVVSTGGGKTGGGGHGGVRQRMQRTPKPKQKPAPLSKYRRKTANARERSRMKEINQAFETLRKAIPQNHSRGDGSYSSGPSAHHRRPVHHRLRAAVQAAVKSGPKSQLSASPWTTLTPSTAYSSTTLYSTT